MKFKVRNNRQNDQAWWVWDSLLETNKESEAYVFDSESPNDMCNIKPYLGEIAGGEATIKIVNS